jgi:hypothetical protein
MRNTVILLSVFFHFSLFIKGQDTLKRSISILAQIPFYSYNYELPLSIGCKIQIGKHAMFAGPVAYPYDGINDKTIGLTGGYLYYPNPENKTFRLFFPININYIYNKYSRVYRWWDYYSNKMKGYKYEGQNSFISFTGGFGFDARIFRNFGSTIQVSIGLGSSGFEHKSYDYDTSKLIYSYHQNLLGDFDATAGINVGFYYKFLDFPVKKSKEED